MTALSRLHRFIGWSQNDYQRHFSNSTTQMFENVTFSCANNNYWHIVVLFLLGVAVVNTDSKEHIQSNFTVIMTNGIGFQVAELQRSNVLQLDVMMPGNTFVSSFSGVPLTCWIKLPCPFLIVSQSDCLIQVVDANSHTEWQTVQIQISWLLQKSTDLDLCCLQRQGISGTSRTGLM